MLPRLEGLEKAVMEGELKTDTAPEERWGNVRVGSTLIPESKTWFCVLHSAKKDENYFPLFSVFTKHLSARQEGLISLFKILQPIGSGYLLTYILCHYTGVSL